MKFPSEEVRWGIVGCGEVCELKSGPALQKADRSSVTAVMRRNGSLAEDFARRHNVASWYDNAEDLISSDDVDAVYVATPPSSHEKYTLMSLAVGKPVFCEKPIALTLAASDRMSQGAKDAGLPLITAYYRRALPRFEKMRKLIQSGEIGTPRNVLAQQWKLESDLPGEAWKLDPAISGGGFFADMYPHALDWFDYTFGPAISVRGVVRNQSNAYAAEDLVSFIIDQNGVIVNGLCSYASDRREDRVTVIGDKGSVSMAFFGPSAVTMAIDGNVTEFNLPDPPHVHQPFVERVISCLLDKGPNPCDPNTARRTVETMENIYRSDVDP